MLNRIGRRSNTDVVDGKIPFARRGSINDHMRITVDEFG